MTGLSAQSIRRLRPITPFHERTVVHGMTFGLGPCGYDVRIAEEVILYPPGAGGGGITDILGGVSFALASTIERFDMPATIRGGIVNKSTWIRRGLVIPTVVIEPGWHGFLTFALMYHGFGRLVIPAGAPIAQIGFEWLDEPTELPYAGKYQDQPAGPVAAIAEGAA